MALIVGHKLLGHCGIPLAGGTKQLASIATRTRAVMSDAFIATATSCRRDATLSTKHAEKAGNVTVVDGYRCHMDKEKRRIEITMPQHDESSPTRADIVRPLSRQDNKEETSSTQEFPESVLQYERQLRKVKAAQKATTPVTKERHLRVVHVDDHVVIVNKPSGILSVPGINHNPSLLSLVHDEYVVKNNPNNQSTPIIKRDSMICHRLDMDTSGLMVFGLCKEATTKLHESFRLGRVDKQYQALVCGHVWADSGSIDLPLQRDHTQPPFMRIATAASQAEAAQAVRDLQHAGWKKLVCKAPQPSQTEFTVLERTHLEADPTTTNSTTFEERLPVTRIALTPITGRTHQLRVHCAAMGHAIVGDPAYGIYGEASANGGFMESTMNAMAPPQRACLALQKSIQDAWNPKQMCLHAKTLSLPHPVTKEVMTWEAPTPF